MSSLSSGRRSALLSSLSLVFLLVSACSSGSKNDSKNGLPDGGPPAGNPPAQSVGLDAVPVGSCGAPASDNVYVSAFTVADCKGSHAMELAGRYTLTEATYPGHTRLYLDAYRDCQPIFEKYVGVPFWDSKLDILTVTPSASSWAAGDRTVTCMVVGAQRAPLGSPARDSRR